MWKYIQKEGAPLPRSSHSLSCVGTNLYVFGGEHRPREPIGSTFYKFDLKTQHWGVVDGVKGNPPSLRLAHGATVTKNLIWIFGGRTGEKKELNDLYVFDTDSRVWSEVHSNGPSPSPRSYLCMASTDSSLYVFGGCSSERLADLWQFNLHKNEWKQLSSQSGPSVRGGSTLVAHKNNLYVLFGFNGTELGDIYQYSISENKWTPFISYGSVPAPRSVHGACSLGDKLFVFGGEKEPSPLGHAGAGSQFDDTFLLDTETGIWEEVPKSSSVPSPRGWIACTSTPDGAAIFGGLNPKNERLGDLYLFVHQKSGKNR